MRTCRVCKQRFWPTRSIQPTCENFDCRVSHANKVAEKLAKKRQTEENRLIKEKKEAIKPTAKLMKEAQAAFNAYIRERDKYFPCISCGRFTFEDALTGGAWDCGHYRSTGAAKHLRFDERNVAKQCKRCNRDLSGNVVQFRKGLVARNGEESVVSVECDNTIKRYTANDYREIRDKYRSKLRELKNKREPI